MKTGTRSHPSCHIPPPAQARKKKGAGTTIDIRSFVFLKRIPAEHPTLATILHRSTNEDEVINRMRFWIQGFLPEDSPARQSYRGDTRGQEELKKLSATMAKPGQFPEAV